MAYNKEAQKRYYEKNKERLRQAHLDNYYANREARLKKRKSNYDKEKAHIYYIFHKEEYDASHKKYVKAHKEEIAEYQRKYGASHPRTDKRDASKLAVLRKYGYKV